MWQKIIIDLLAKVIAACFVMIIHEFTKAQIYIIINKKNINNNYNIRNENNILKYIDPIGLLLYIFCNAGFSRPTIFFLRDKKTSSNLGIFGLLSHMIIFFLFCGVARIMLTESSISYFSYFLNSLVFRLALFSFSGFIVNLIPLSTFDMGLIIAGKSVDHFINLLRMDLFMKTLIVVSISIGFIYEFSYSITKLFIFS